MAEQLAGGTERLTLVLPTDRGDLLGSLRRNGQVLTADYADDGIHVRAVLPKKFVAAFASYRHEPDGPGSSAVATSALTAPAA